MNTNEEADGAEERTPDSEESTDQSLTDSWTVLDSSHLKEDADLSDAESVEVLTSEEPEPVVTHQETDESYKVKEEVGSAATDLEEADAAEASAPEETETAATPESTTPSAATESSKEKQKKPWLEELLIAVAVELSIFTLIVDLLFLGYLGVSVSGIDRSAVFPLSMKSSKSHQQFEVDPLSLQLSHVLAEWKKHPSEDHSLDRHILKTLLLYYGESTELSANLHFLTEKVKKHNEVIRHFGKEKDGKNTQSIQMIITGHLAHSIACILGKHDNDKAVPADLAKTANSKGESNDFAPEPGFWLNDWNLPQYFKANDTYYRIDTRPIPPPMQNLYLHLGSAKWNQYFWDLYHGDKKAEESDEIITEDELEGEETERSPLDSNAAVDFLSDIESSGNIVNTPDNPENRLGVLHSLFVGDLDSEDSEKPVYETHKFEDFGSHFGDCWNQGCKKLYKIKSDDVQKDENDDNPGQGKIASDHSSEGLKKKKSKVRGSKRKYKSLYKTEGESVKGKKKEDKTDKLKLDVEDIDFSQKKKSKGKENKRKGKIGNVDALNENSSLKFDEKVSRDFMKNLRKKLTDEKIFDWNSKMAQGREDLRALREKGDDRLWLFERARGRRDLREETYSE